jgi:hypothetical protein
VLASVISFDLMSRRIIVDFSIVIFAEPVIIADLRRFDYGREKISATLRVTILVGHS